MKKLFSMLGAVLILSIIAVVGVFADASGEMYKLYNNSVIVNNTWEYVESEKTLYIRSKLQGVYNETGCTSYDTENGAWAAYKDEIEHVILEGSFAKCSGKAFKNHTSLKTVRITDGTSQFDGSCFEGCTNLESVTVGTDDHVVGYADLTNASILRGNRQFFGTKITKAFTSNSISSTGTEQFNEGTTIYVPKTAAAYDVFVNSGRYNVIDSSPVVLSINVNGEVYENLYSYGSMINFPTVGDDCVVLYKDAEFTEPYTNFAATENITLYGKPLLECMGAMVRIEDYHGLRMIYKVDESAIDVLHGYEIKEFGALSVKQKGIKTKLTVEMEDVHRAVVYADGTYKGSVLKVPNNGVTEFAYTAVGFEQDGRIVVENADQNLYFRGYIILTDPVSGKDIVCYSSMEKMNLADGCHKTLLKNEESDESILSDDDIAFIKSPLDAGATINYIYNKQELLNVLRTVYDDPDHYIPGQHLGTSGTSLSTFLDDSYAESGCYPALIAFDLMDMTVYNSKVQSIIAECKEYISRGGIVSFSYHMENPTGNYTPQGLCRGELGGEDKWIELMTDGTDLNKRFNEILDYAGLVLNEFDKEGYPVIWRPLHENNGGWFWWCAIQTFEENGKEVTRAIDQEIFIDLWEYVYKYYTEVWGLKHLVWAYSPNVTNSNSPMPVLYGYPGAEYCDIAGTDWYTSGKFEVHGTSKCYETLSNASGLPAALTEFGPSGDLRADASQGELQIDVFSCKEELDLMKRMMDEGLKLTYVLNWSGNWSMLSMGNMGILMNDEVAFDLPEVKAIFNDEFAKRN